MERNYFRCSARPKHEKLYDSMNIQGCGDKIATQMGDCSEGQLDPLASPSDDDKDTGWQPDGYTASQRNGYTAHMNDTNHHDVMLGTSNIHQLPISFFKSSIGPLRDVTAMIGARSARRANIMIGINSARDATIMIGTFLAPALGYASNIAYASPTR